MDKQKLTMRVMNIGMELVPLIMDTVENYLEDVFDEENLHLNITMFSMGMAIHMYLQQKAKNSDQYKEYQVAFISVFEYISGSYVKGDNE